MSDETTRSRASLTSPEHAESIVRHVADAITVQAPDGTLVWRSRGSRRRTWSAAPPRRPSPAGPGSSTASRSPRPRRSRARARRRRPRPGPSRVDGPPRTINDILWASRLDSGTLRVHVESCDAAALVREVVEATRAHLPERMTLALWDTELLPPVSADPDKVGQVLANLLDNATKYSPEGGVVEVRLRRHANAVRFSVRDEGLGIAPAEQRRIFEKFYRVDPNLTRGIGGTGLGLYICRELVRRMGGSIWVESREGEGSTFSFELPVEGTAAAVPPVHSV